MEGTFTRTRCLSARLNFVTQVQYFWNSDGSICSSNTLLMNILERTHRAVPKQTLLWIDSVSVRRQPSEQMCFQIYIYKKHQRPQKKIIVCISCHWLQCLLTCSTHCVKTGVNQTQSKILQTFHFSWKKTPINAITSVLLMLHYCSYVRLLLWWHVYTEVLNPSPRST